MGIYWKWVNRKTNQHINTDLFGETDKHPVCAKWCLASMAALVQWNIWDSESTELITDLGVEDFYRNWNNPPLDKLKAILAHEFGNKAPQFNDRWFPEKVK